VADHGWPWFCTSIVLTIFLHDAYFYWTHRLMHHRRLFPIFHRVHHLSHNPSPWAAYAFHPAEGLVQAGILPLTAILIPIHPLAFAIFMMWQLTDNILGHTGYEFYPRWLMKTPLKFFLNPPTHHAMHHEKMHGNYGIYFNFWDRLMGTNHPHYEARFLEVTTRERESLPPHIPAWLRGPRHKYGDVSGEGFSVSARREEGATTFREANVSLGATYSWRAGAANPQRSVTDEFTK
jgi:sterol desaturase/sphingolipid hydroxylase (fatty acid hydroxylase superfamily)